MEIDTELRELLRRGVIAVEALAEDPVIHVESGPPVCPFCEMMNPKVLVRESEASGPLGEYLLQAQCQNCNELFYAVPQIWLTVRTITEVQTEMQARRDRGNS